MNIGRLKLQEGTIPFIGVGRFEILRGGALLGLIFEAFIISRAKHARGVRGNAPRENLKSRHYFLHFGPILTAIMLHLKILGEAWGESFAFLTHCLYTCLNVCSGYPTLAS